MALEDISKLFSNRVSHITDSDIAYGIERFLRSVLRSQHIQCRTDGRKSSFTIRVPTPALAQAALVYEYDIRLFASTELGCTIGSICVLL